MPFGSILAGFKEVRLKTADEKEFYLKNNFFTRLGFKIIGIPHLEMRIRARKIFSFLPKQGNNKKILDAGCGPGIYAITLLKKEFNVFAIDIDKEKLSYLKENSDKINVKYGDLTNIPFKKEYFDYIVCSDVIEHIKKDYLAIKSLSKVLKKGGRLILTVPAESKKNKKDYKRFGHERVGYNIKTLKILAQKNQLKILELKKYSGPLVGYLFSLNEKLYNHKLLSGLFFYPMYFLTFLEDLFNLHSKQFNGIAVCLIKNWIDI